MLSRFCVDLSNMEFCLLLVVLFCLIFVKTGQHFLCIYLFCFFRFKLHLFFTLCGRKKMSVRSLQKKYDNKNPCMTAWIVDKFDNQVAVPLGYECHYHKLQKGVKFEQNCSILSQLLPPEPSDVPMKRPVCVFQPHIA